MKLSSDEESVLKAMPADKPFTVELLVASTGLEAQRIKKSIHALVSKGFLEHLRKPIQVTAN